MVTNTTTVPAAAAEPPLILAIDAGTSSTRVVLYDRLGRLLDGIGSQERYQIRQFLGFSNASHGGFGSAMGQSLLY